MIPYLHLYLHPYLHLRCPFFAFLAHLLCSITGVSLSACTSRQEGIERILIRNKAHLTCWIFSKVLQRSKHDEIALFPRNNSCGTLYQIFGAAITCAYKKDKE